MRNAAAQEEQNFELDIDIHGELVSSINLHMQRVESGLFAAAKTGNVELVVTYLSKGANVNFVYVYNNHTPLTIALENEHEECAIELIKQGANVNFVRHIRTEWGSKCRSKWDINVSPLYIAAEKGLLKCVQLLCEVGANPAFMSVYDIPLTIALKNGHTKCATELINKAKELNIITYCININIESSIIFIAAKEGNLECLKLLDIKKKDLNYTSRNDSNKNDQLYYSSLQIALKNGHLECAVYLMSKGATEWFGKGSGTPKPILYMAAEQGNISCIQSLCLQGININCSYKLVTPLMIALENGHTNCVSELVNNGAVLNTDLITKFMYIVSEKGHVDCIKLLFQHSERLNFIYNDFNNSLKAALINGHADCARELISRGAVVNVDLIEKCGYIAGENGFLDCIKLLNEHGADINFIYKNTYTALTIALEQNSIECAVKLINKGAIVNVPDQFKGKSALYIAAEKGLLDCIKLLNEHGADLNFIYNINVNRKYTPLIIATQNKHIECVEFLVSKGATLDRLQGNVASPVHLLAEKGKVASLRVLCENEADVNCIDPYQHSPLTSAIKNNQAACVELLLKFGASVVYQVHNTGWTPLHCAAESDSAECAKLLLLYGADLYARDKSDQTPLMLATSKRSNKVITIIQKFMKDGAQAFDDSTSEMEALRETIARQSEEIAQLKLIIAQRSNFNQQDPRLPAPDRSLIFSTKRTIPESEITTELVVNSGDNSVTTAGLDGKSKTIPKMWGI